jgi:TRAP-type C4-dicarboxylate transport system permease small subunit
MILADALPDNSGYVVAAYLVFFALLLVYVAIMAFKITRLERDVTELNELADREQEPLPATLAEEART